MDASIHEDELEHDRILLERNLQMHHTENSFLFSSTGGDDRDNDLEYARHDSAPSPEFVAHKYHGRNPYTDDATHSQLHSWSYRTGEDEEGIHPYGETISTTNHHASGVTLTAGLAGTRSRRAADASFSGAEYDPERPIDAMIAGVEKLSMFNVTEPSKSKHSNMTFDPLIVDSTAELDRILESGHQPPPSLRSHDKSVSQHSRSVRLRSPPHSSNTTTSDEENHAHRPDSRPKLVDALRRVSFSPKRPRSPHSTPRASSSQLPRGNTSAHRHDSSPLARVTSNYDGPDLTQDIPTPRPTRRPSSSSSPPPRVASSSVRVARQPPLRLAKPLRGKVGEQKREGSSKSHQRMNEGENERDREEDILARPSSAYPLSRHVPNHRQPTPLRKSSLKVTPRLGKVQLPDLTGLTSAVESPAKMRLADGSYMGMAALRSDETTVREVEARLIRTLNAVQSRLEHLEEENGVSRRRVRELEYELEDCKREVVRERTKLLEETAELSGVIQAANIVRTLGKRSFKGKGKAKETAATNAANLSAAEERYREVVEEKKALEALITSLRSHLTRLTSELSEQQSMLTELRSLREQDAIALRDKLAEVDNLKIEVERLAGEVEVLRGVVEEGLRERRRPGRDVSIDASIGPEDRGMSVDEEGEPANNAACDTDESSDGGDMEDNHPDNNTNTVTNDDDPWSIDGSSRANTTANPNNTDMHNDSDAPAGITRPDHTMRTDRASLGSSVPALGISTVSNGPAIATQANAARANTTIDVGNGGYSFGEIERSRIEAEIEERRSFRGSFDASRLSISPRPKLDSPSLQRRTMVKTRKAMVENADSDDEREAVDLGREMRTRPRPVTPTSQSHFPERAPAPTPYHAMAGPDPAPRQHPQKAPFESRKDGGELSCTPFPKIRGEYLERLFFSAPEHDTRTCTACSRRRRPANMHTLAGDRYDWAAERCGGEDVEDDTIGQLLPSRYDQFLKTRKGKQKEGEPYRVASDSGQRRTDPEDEGFAEGSSEDGTALRGGKRDKGKQRAVGFEEVTKTAGRSGLPPQTVVTRVIRELENDFTHYKSIYCELADRYKEMDTVSEVRRRNILAEHLKEVISILEQKGDQIASLYDLLSFKDKPATESVVPSKTGSWGINMLWSKKP